MKKKKTTGTTVISIKNMVCDRCVRVVKDELSQAGFKVQEVRLGEAEILDEIDSKKMIELKKLLLQNGFELLENSQAKLIESVKRTIIALIQQDRSKEPLKENYSAIISRTVGKDYHSLSVLFSAKENLTIEKYIIIQRIERAKELLKYGDTTLSEIAFQIGYSSVQHLSSQFKTVTGMTPSEFKKQSSISRISIDKVQ